MSAPLQTPQQMGRALYGDDPRRGPYEQGVLHGYASAANAIEAHISDAARLQAVVSALRGGRPPATVPPPSWETPSAFAARSVGLTAVGKAIRASAARERDAAMLDALQACVVPGNDAATVENIRGVMAALKGERR